MLVVSQSFFRDPIMLAVKEDCCRILASIKCRFTDTIEPVSVRFFALLLLRFVGPGLNEVFGEGKNDDDSWSS